MSYVTVLVLLTTMLLGATSGLLGCFAVLRGRALLGDVLAHAALPGICLAFLLVRERHLGALLGGAIVAGLFAILVLGLLRRFVRTKEDAALGIVLTVFFGLGIVLLSVIQRLPAGGERAGLSHYLFGQAAAVSQADLFLISGVGVVAGLTVFLLYKELLVVSFDPGFAGVQGWPVAAVDLLLFSLIAVVTMIGLPVVGVVLMAALLIIPPAAARFWTDRLGQMLVLAAAFGALAGAAGTIFSAGFLSPGRTGSHAGLPTGPMIILTGTVIFLASMLCAPQKGLLWRAVRLIGLRVRTAEEHLLRELYECIEAGLPDAAPVAIVTLKERLRWSGAGLWTVIGLAAMRGFVRAEDGQLRLTPKGFEKARQVVRAHRLWELFLIEQAGIAPDHVHRDADQMEHLLRPEVVTELEEKLQTARRMAEDAKKLPASPH
ncbi:MAG: metal ABC transporter permease [Thermoguttaceae bacterium]|nr:metal ABC transporter permease [Thermoguttaceae bacterium]MDW8079267.1 metal ABC transporter permease [Thermoguttaceae bacterium]